MAEAQPARDVEPLNGKAGIGAQGHKAVGEGLVIEGAALVERASHPEANTAAVPKARNFVEQLVFAVEAQLQVGDNLLVAPPKIGTGEV